MSRYSINPGDDLDYKSAMSNTRGEDVDFNEEGYWKMGYGNWVGLFPNFWQYREEWGNINSQ